MSNTEFENKLLSELQSLNTKIDFIDNRIGGLDEKVASLDKKVTTLDGKFNRLDDRLDEVEANLKQEMRVQGAYLNQAFDRMNFLNQQANSSASFK